MLEKVKVAVIGGGSSYTPELIDGFIRKTQTLPVKEIVLVDIQEGYEKLKVIQALTQRMLEKAGLEVAVSATIDRKEALKGCSYVITQLRVGGLDARSRDEKIPLKYNTVGQETTGPGGFAKALRTVPVILAIAKDMEQICPDAWLINFTNPSGIVTEAVKKYSKIKCIGLCNVPINMEKSLAEHLNVPVGELYCEFVGLNHLSWIKKVYVKGVDRTKELFSQALFQEDILKNVPKVEGSKELIEFLQLIPSPYLNYFYFENEMIKEELESLNSGKGTRADKVKEVEKELFEIYANPDLKEKPAQLSERGGAWYSEVAVSLIESIHNNLGRMHVLNVPNSGAFSGISNTSVVETNCIVNSSGAHPIATGDLPESIYSLVVRVKSYEQFTIEAAVSGSKEDAFLALLNHPLVHGAELARVLLKEILEANKEYLPQFYKAEVEG